MNKIEKLDGSPGFVRLQVSDQMPSRRLASYFRNLGFRFLHTILAQIGNSDRDRLLNAFGGMCLADGYERNVARGAIHAECGLGYLFLHMFQTLAELCLMLRL